MLQMKRCPGKTNGACANESDAEGLWLRHLGIFQHGDTGVASDAS